MSKESQMYAQLLQTLNGYLSQNFQQQQQAAATESPYLTRLGTDATKFLNQVDSGDLRNVQEGSFFNMDPLADVEKQRDLLYNSGATGQAALGGSGANPTLLALDKQNRADELSQNYGSQFQDAIQGATANAKQTLAGLGEMEQNRRAGAASNSAGLLGGAFSAINQKKPSFLSSLATGGLQALPGILGALGDGGTMKKGGKYRIGSENVMMKRDGTALVTPSQNPIARHLQKLAERADMAPSY